MRTFVPPQRLRFQWKGGHFSPPARSVHSSSPCVLLTPCTSRHAAPSSLSSAPWPQDRVPKKKARVLKGKARSPEVRLNSLAPRALAPLNLALATSQPRSVTGTVAAASDGDGAHNHGRRFSNDVGGRTLARHRSAHWRASGFFRALLWEPTDVRHVEGERCRFWQHD